MLQEEHREAIWAGCCGVAGICYGLPDMVGCEEDDRVPQPYGTSKKRDKAYREKTFLFDHVIDIRSVSSNDTNL